MDTVTHCDLAVLVFGRIMSMSVELQSSTTDNNGFSAVSVTDADTPTKLEDSDLEAATQPPEESNAFNASFLTTYSNKLRGQSGKSPDRSPIYEIIFTSVLGFIGILLVSVTGYWYLGKEFTSENGTAVSFISGAFAATSGDQKNTMFVMFLLFV